MNMAGVLTLPAKCLRHVLLPWRQLSMVRTCVGMIYKPFVEKTFIILFAEVSFVLAL